jgi:hypothetical protein
MIAFGQGGWNMFGRFLSASGRRALLVVGVSALLCAASTVRAYQAQAPAEDPFKIAGDFGMLVFQIKADKTADFESAWNTIKDKLSKSDKPDLKEQGDSIKIFRVNVPPAPAAAGAPAQPAVYIFYLAPPSKTLSYEPTKILYDSKTQDGKPVFERAEADAIYKKIAEAFAGLSSWPMSKVL